MGTDSEDAPRLTRPFPSRSPRKLYELVEKARKVERRSRSEVIQEAIRTHFGEPVYVPTAEERRMLDEALADLERDPDSGRP